MAYVEPIALTGLHVVLEPLALSHLAGLQAACADGALWKLWYTSVPEPEKMAENIAFRLGKQREGSMVPLVVKRAEDGRVVGATTFCNIVAEQRRVEIGYTWYAQSAQRSALNTEAKLLMLTHAFEQVQCVAVEFRTHWMNQQSRAAIERLGAKLDGVLRSHIGRHGELRDTCVYSILATEWPTVKLHLQQRLAAR